MKRPLTQANIEEDEDDDEDEDESCRLLQRSKTQLDKFSADDEQEAMAWFREHPELYAKSIKYTNAGYKTRIYRTKANEMGIHREYSAYHIL